MDTDSIRIWICFALGFGLIELFTGRLVFISAALGCLSAPLIVALLSFKGSTAPSPYLLAAGIAVVTYIVLALWLWRVREPKKAVAPAAGPVGVRFTLGPTIPGRQGPEFILRIGRRVYVVECPERKLRTGEEVEITAIGDETVTVKTLTVDDEQVKSPFGGRFRSMALPDPPAEVTVKEESESSVEEIEEEEEEVEAEPIDEPIVQEEPTAEPPAQGEMFTEAEEDELSPLLDSIEKAVGTEPEVKSDTGEEPPLQQEDQDKS